jgi:uncharacterized membrane protein YfcA
MDYSIVLIGSVTLVGAALTLFSGFGLRTLLLPVFALFFPIEIAIGLTAIVHFSNNLIKVGFFYKHVDWSVILRFGTPSVIAAFLGAYLLTLLTELKPIFKYSMHDIDFFITPIKLTISVLLLVFSLIELLPKLSAMEFDKKHLPIGGVLSGFFGGLSGL